MHAQDTIASPHLRVAEKARLSRVLGDLELPDRSMVTARKFINKVDSYGMTPLQIALNKENIKNAQILIGNGADINIRYVSHYSAEV